MADVPTPHVAVLSPVDDAVIDWLRERCDVDYLPGATDEDLATGRFDDADVVLLRSNVALRQDTLAGMTRLRHVLRAGSGSDNIDTDELRRRGIEVVRLGGGPAARSVAELALGLAIALLRHVPPLSSALVRGDWARDAWPPGREVAGSTVAVWGAGAVGRACATLFEVLGADVTFLAHRSVPEAARARDLDALGATCDVHVLAVPLRPDTASMLGTEALATMREQRPVVVNVARWEIADCGAVVTALRNGWIGGYAADPVNRSHLREVESLGLTERLNLLLTPHIGATTHEARRRISAEAIGRLEDVFARLWPTAVTGRT